MCILLKRQDFLGNASISLFMLCLLCKCQTSRALVAPANLAEAQLWSTSITHRFTILRWTEVHVAWVGPLQLCKVGMVYKFRAWILLSKCPFHEICGFILHMYLNAFSKVILLDPPSCERWEEGPARQTSANDCILEESIQDCGALTSFCHDLAKTFWICHYYKYSELVTKGTEGF